MRSDKIKIEIDLLRDSLRNLFVVMFAVVSAEVSLFYKLLENYDIIKVSLFICGLVVLYVIHIIRKEKLKDLKNLLEKLEE